MSEYINEKRMTDEFLQLACIDSVSFGERQIADILKAKLEGLGFIVHEDDAGAAFGSDTGNIYGFLKGTLPGKPLLFSSHMDTVVPCTGKKPSLKDGVISSDGTTVLGGDDICGIVEIIEAVRAICESGQSHRDIEVLFTVAEEVFSRGAAVFDYSMIKAETAFTADMSRGAGTAALMAPSIISFKADICGKAAHAGFEPENGIHAVAVSAAAVSAMDLGHVDGETTVNIGRIEGGNAVNIVPEKCVCEGEVRSFDHDHALAVTDDIKRLFIEKADEAGASCEFTYSIDVRAFETGESEEAPQLFARACRQEGIDPVFVRTFGGSDNNNFALHGIRGIVLSCGMYNAHSVREYAVVSEMVKCARIISRIMCMNEL